MQQEGKQEAGLRLAVMPDPSLVWGVEWSSQRLFPSSLTSILYKETAKVKMKLAVKNS